MDHSPNDMELAGRSGVERGTTTSKTNDFTAMLPLPFEDWSNVHDRMGQKQRAYGKVEIHKNDLQ